MSDIEDTIANRVADLTLRIAKDHGIADASPLVELRDSLQTRRGTPEVLARLRDPQWLPELITYAPVKHAGAAYIVPGLLAWTMLAMAEFFFSSSGASDTSFFGWWSRQPLSPMIYSLVVAVSLLWVVVRELGATFTMHRQHEIAQDVEREGAVIAVMAAAGAQSVDATLAYSAHQLTGAATALDRLVASFGQSEQVLQATRQATDQAQKAAEAIDRASQSLAAPANRLGTTLEGLAPLLGTWPSTNEEMKQSLGRVEAESAALAAHLTQLGEVSQTLLESARESTRAVSELSTVTTANASAQPGVEATSRLLQDTAASLSMSQEKLAKLHSEVTIMLGLADNGEPRTGR